MSRGAMFGLGINLKMLTIAMARAMGAEHKSYPICASTLIWQAFLLDHIVRALVHCVKSGTIRTDEHVSKQCTR